MSNRQQRLKKKDAYQELTTELTNIMCTLFGKPSIVKSFEEEREVYSRIQNINDDAKERRRNKFIKG